MALNFLLFATIIILMMAYGPHGNSIAAAIATTALTLVLFLGWLQHKMRDKSLFSSPHSMREEKRERQKSRASRTLVSHGDTTKMKSNAGEQLASMVGMATQHAVMAMKRENNGATGDEILHVGCAAALSALQAVIPFAAKRPNLTEKEIEERGGAEVMKLINPDTLLFGALLVANMQDSMEPIDVGINHVKGGVEAACTCSSGPIKIFRAIKQWETLTGKNPDDVFHPEMLRVAREAGAAEIREQTPFDAFLEKRRTSVPTSKTLQ